ncbi:MAG: zinc-dependent peptidase [Balneolaceae bacterium]|nr:zinc-dependent peptidase [Balneolaceae bacterium]
MPLIRYLKRKYISSRPFPESWVPILESKVPVYRRLPKTLRDTLKKHIPIVISEKNYEGCGGLTLSEEMKVIITAYACVLILKEKADYYSDLQSILVYPDSYVAPVSEMDEGGIVSEGFEPRSGEYWGTGNIVLAWCEIKKNLSESGKGQNLIYHEFSHLLDDRYGLTAGITLEGKALREDEWTRVLASSYKKHGRNMNESRRSVLDEYGTRSPAEFFSVASEAFFEAPDALHREMPDLYRVLRSFYALDPLSWRG